MADIAGEWASTAQSPMGVQNSTMTFTATGDDTFAGSSTGPMGTMEITDGAVAGDKVTFTMKVTKPFPMTLKADATLSGDAMEGAIDTGAFGKMAFKATRKA